MVTSFMYEHSLHAQVLSLGGAGMKVFSGHAFCISWRIPLSVATMKVFELSLILYFKRAAVEPTLSANFTTVPLHSG